MKKNLFLSLLLVFIYPATFLSQISFERTYGGTDYDVGYSVQQTEDEGYIIAGITERDVYLIKTDPLGDTLWTRTLDCGDIEKGYSVQQTTDGGYVIAGSIRFGSHNIFESVLLIKTDASGDTLWTRTYEGSIENLGQENKGYSVQQTTDGGYVIAGCTGYSSKWGGTADLYLIKTDASGDTLWTQTYGDSLWDEGRSVQQTIDEGYVIAGCTWSFGSGNSDVYLIKTDSSGDTLWTRTYGGAYEDVGYSVQQTTDEGYIIAGCTNCWGDGSDVFLIKIDSSGDTLWTRTYGGTYEDVGNSVQQTFPDSGYIIAGYTTSFGSGEQDVYLIKTDSLGDTLWTRIYGGTSSDVGESVQQTEHGGYIIAGFTESFGVGFKDVYLIKTDPDGMVGILDNKPPSIELPRSWSLSQNYPNPFNPSTTISFEVPGISVTKQHVTLAVYDIRGRLVRTLVSSEITPGNHKIHWDGRNDRGEFVSSGIYLYTLKTGAERYTRKMTILK